MVPLSGRLIWSEGPNKDIKNSGISKSLELIFNEVVDWLFTIFEFVAILIF
jgi:hypothetical protein